MQLTRVPFWTELNFWVLLEKTVAALRPEKAFTVEASDDPTLDEAAAKAAGATTAEAATMEAIASESALEARDEQGGEKAAMEAQGAQCGSGECEAGGMSYWLEGEPIWKLGATHEKGEREQKVDNVPAPGLDFIKWCFVIFAHSSIPSSHVYLQCSFLNTSLTVYHSKEHRFQSKKKSDHMHESPTYM